MPTKSSSSSARSASGPLTASAPSCAEGNSRSGATTFSSTVISPEQARDLERAADAAVCARATARSRSIRSPSNQTSPASGGIVPPIRLKTVVLPEPFGPISAVIEPSRDRERAAVDGLHAAEALLEPLAPRAAARTLSRRAPRAAEPLARAGRAGQTLARQAGLAARAPALDPMVGGRDDARGRNRTTSASSPPKIRSRALPPPNSLLRRSR